MGQCFITPQAQRDLREVWLYVSGDDLSAADRLVDRLLSVAELIADQPQMGRPRHDLAPNVRAFAVDRRYLLFYRIVDDGIEVLHMVHGARDLRLLGFFE